MKFREFHIWNLPQDKIWVKLEQNFRREILEKAGNLFQGNWNERYTKLANVLGYSNHSVIQRWMSGYEGSRKYEVLIPLTAIHRLLDLLKNNNIDVSFEKIENHIIKLRSKTGNSIDNPVFPITEDERLVRIIFHLLGDGYCVSKGSPAYINTSKQLIEGFAEDLKVLGDVPTRTIEYPRETKTLYKLQFPIVVSHIILSIYKISFKSHDSTIPPKIFDLPEKIKVEGIRAFGDDEANVDSNRIRFYSSNKKLLKQFRKLVIQIRGIKEKDVSKVKNIKENLKDNEYCFYIRSTGLKIYAKKVGFLHPKKRNHLSYVIRRTGTGQLNRRKEGITKRIILDAIKNGINTIKDLSIDIGIDESNIYRHLQELKTKGLVKSTGKIGKRRKWELI